MSDPIFTFFEYKIHNAETKFSDAYVVEGSLDPAKFATLEKYFQAACFAEKGNEITWKGVKKTKSKKDGIKRSNVESMEDDSHTARVIENKEGIIIIYLQSNKSKKVRGKDFSEQPVPDHPPFYVIFDNRPGHNLLAIERKAMKTDDAVAVIENAINWVLNQRGIAICIKGFNKMPQNYHEGIEFLKNTLNRRITKVSFEFKDNKHVKDLPPDVGQFIEHWMRKFSEGGKIEAFLGNDDSRLSRVDIKQDIEALAKLCTRYGNYVLETSFGDWGVYRYGKELKAQFGLSLKVLEEFVNPRLKETSLPLGDVETSIPLLPNWLDDIKKVLNAYDKTPLSPKRRSNLSRTKLK